MCVSLCHSLPSSKINVFKCKNLVKIELIDKLGYRWGWRCGNRSERWYPNDWSLGNNCLRWLSCSFNLEKPDKLSLSPVGPSAPRSLWSHGLQPSQRPCSLPPAYQNEAMAMVPTLGGFLPFLSSCLQGFHTSLWQLVEVASLEVAQGWRYSVMCGRSFSAILWGVEAPQGGSTGIKQASQGWEEKCFQVWKVPRNPSPWCCNVMCCMNICFLRQWLACWLLSSSLLALIWWRPVFSSWMDQEPISLLCGLCLAAYE